MTKTQKKAELNKLVVKFFDTKVHSEAVSLKETIRTQVLALPYSVGVAEVLKDIIINYNYDLNSYFVSFEQLSATNRSDAFLAFALLINFVDLSQLED